MRSSFLGFGPSSAFLNAWVNPEVVQRAQQSFPELHWQVWEGSSYSLSSGRLFFVRVDAVLCAQGKASQPLSGGKTVACIRNAVFVMGTQPRTALCKPKNVQQLLLLLGLPHGVLLALPHSTAMALGVCCHKSHGKGVGSLTDGSLYPSSMCYKQ